MRSEIATVAWRMAGCAVLPLLAACSGGGSGGAGTTDSTDSGGASSGSSSGGSGSSSGGATGAAPVCPMGATTLKIVGGSRPVNISGVDGTGVISPSNYEFSVNGGSQGVVTTNFIDPGNAANLKTGDDLTVGTGGVAFRTVVQGGAGSPVSETLDNGSKVHVQHMDTTAGTAAQGTTVNAATVTWEGTVNGDPRSGCETYVKGM